MTAVNYKMADLSRGAKKEEKGRGRMAKTHFGNLASPPFCSSSPWDQTRGRIWTSKSFPSSGELSGPAEWIRRAFISSGGITATLCQKARLLFSHTLPQMLENIGLWSPDKANSSHSLWLLLPLKLRKTIKSADVQFESRVGRGKNPFILGHKMFFLVPLLQEAFGLH